MDGKKKVAGWLVLTAIAVVAAVALATTNIVTEGPIAQRNLGEAQAALEGMFPEAGTNGFEEMSAGEPAGLGFAYMVKQNGETIGYAVKETVQGYAGPVEVVLGVDTGMSLRGISVGGSGFQETEGLGAKAKDAAFTDQFKGKTPPLSLEEDIDAIAGATITSRAVVDSVNNGVSKLKTLIDGENGQAAPENSQEDGGVQAGVAAQFANASAIGYGGPVLVRLGLEDGGAIASVEIGRARFQETEGLGARVKEEAFTSQFIGKTPPIAIDDVDGISGATISTKAAVDAINEAAAFLKP